VLASISYRKRFRVAAWQPPLSTLLGDIKMEWQDPVATANGSVSAPIQAPS
jgi:hypothetical protein